MRGDSGFFAVAESIDDLFDGWQKCWRISIVPALDCCFAADLHELEIDWAALAAELDGRIEFSVRIYSHRQSIHNSFLANLTKEILSGWFIDMHIRAS